MIRDGLIRAAPPAADDPCVICGRASPAAVEVGSFAGAVRYVCPQHATLATPGPLPDELIHLRDPFPRVRST
ncbi:hypothetical protein AB0G74_11700 [Streptomyces sp. NPDC020875]|uniref:hypothetical protein n=1 Tax=Streptomyces sp. NPDC020875 TaxID=3154898 RepID=UPI0033F6072B